MSQSDASRRTPRRHAVPARIRRGEEERRWRPVDGRHAGRGPLEGERDGEDPAPRSEVENGAGCGRGLAGDLDDPFRLAARNERAGVDREGPTEKLPLAEEVLKRDAGGAARHESPERRRVAAGAVSARRAWNQARGRPRARARSSSASKTGCSGPESSRRPSARRSAQVAAGPTPVVHRPFALPPCVFKIVGCLFPRILTLRRASPPRAGGGSASPRQRRRRGPCSSSSSAGRSPCWWRGCSSRGGSARGTPRGDARPIREDGVRPRARRSRGRGRLLRRPNRPPLVLERGRGETVRPRRDGTSKGR